MKRKPIPKVLHSELTDYTSLLRALRTRNTLDVTSHIMRTAPSKGDALNSDDDDDDKGHTSQGVHNDTDTASSSSSHTGGAARGRHDNWTRWPLLFDDVAVPEWGFEDEVSTLAAQALKLRPPARLSVSALSPDSGPEEDAEGIDPDLNPDTPSYIPHLTACASTQLAKVLALLAAHTPIRAPSLQNRIEPLDWQSVINILSSCGDPSVADEKCVHSPRRRHSRASFPRVTFNLV